MIISQLLRPAAAPRRGTARCTRRIPMRPKWSAVAAMVFIGVGGSGSRLTAAEPGIKSAVLKPTPLIARTPEGERQVVLVEIDSPGLNDAVIRLTDRDWSGPVELRIGELAKGKQAFRLQVPVARKDG